jgi:hypothetical protein
LRKNKSVADRWRKLPHWEEFSTASLLKSGFMTDQELQDYLPSLDPKKLERTFLWYVFGGLHQSDAEEYYQFIYDEKMRARLPKPQKLELNIEPEWMEKLLLY